MEGDGCRGAESEGREVCRPLFRIFARHGFLVLLDRLSVVDVDQLGCRAFELDFVGAKINGSEEFMKLRIVSLASIGDNLRPFDCFRLSRARLVSKYPPGLSIRALKAFTTGRFSTLADNKDFVPSACFSR
ncbi:hypothetical protein ASF56_20800 [Methylobacterium sp. Leaf122]|nr:hypothetical protein ASF56_20800 [Methylobacterium sp. Leaf122]